MNSRGKFLVLVEFNYCMTLNLSQNGLAIELIHNAVKILRAGGLVAFPTETVYGLGADASNPEAVRKIFTVKGRPPDHPVIVGLETFPRLRIGLQKPSCLVP
jgi:tRNA A37 threonylcarbamoyladenosine synthetase subunit TsaC/SUA5/YrdC